MFMEYVLCNDKTAKFGPQIICIEIQILRAENVPPPIEIQRRLIQVGLYGNRVTGVHVTKWCLQFENCRPVSRSARHSMGGCERNMSGGNDFLAADATLERSQIQQ
jgi:hypothetical protein